MYRKITLLVAALALAAGIGASSASAATLYTSAAHSTPVAVGSTFTATTSEAVESGYDAVLYLGGGTWYACKTHSYSFKVTQNSGGVFKAQVTANNFPPSGCTGTGGPIQGFSTGTLQVNGTSVANGSNTAWLGSTLNGVEWTWSSWPGVVATGNFTSATGSPPANGMFTQQPTIAKAPVSVVLKHAGSWTGIGPAGQFSATYTLTGTAASWSFG
jgi:hypothetical protein